MVTKKGGWGAHYLVSGFYSYTKMYNKPASAGFAHTTERRFM